LFQDPSYLIVAARLLSHHISNLICRKEFARDGCSEKRAREREEKEKKERAIGAERGRLAMSLSSLYQLLNHIISQEHNVEAQLKVPLMPSILTP